ncbi:MAG: hypothetical protein HYU36_13190 [Planctomycetes bacterium]|nr:hypothetical protein [Planctomycetota bacterium]
MKRHPWTPRLPSLALLLSLVCLPLLAQMEPPTLIVNGPAQGILGEKLTYQASFSPPGGILSWSLQPTEMGALEAFSAEARSVFTPAQTGDARIIAQYEISGYPATTVVLPVQIAAPASADGGSSDGSAGPEEPAGTTTSDGGSADPTGTEGGDASTETPPGSDTSEPSATVTSGGSDGSDATAPPTARIGVPTGYVLYPGTIVQLSALPADVKFTWSAADGIDVDSTGRVLAYRPGLARVRIQATVTSGGVDYEISDEKFLDVSTPALVLTQPPDVLYEGHEATITAEAFPAAGEWRNWSLLQGADIASLEAGTVENLPTYKDTPVAGAAWMKAEGIVKLDRYGVVVVTAAYVIPHSQDATKDYSQTITLNLRTSDLGVRVAGDRSIFWKHCSNDSPDEPSSDSPDGTGGTGTPQDSPDGSPSPSSDEPSEAYQQGYADGYQAGLAHVQSGTSLSAAQQETLLNGWSGTDDYSVGFLNGYIAAEMGYSSGSTATSPDPTATSPSDDPSSSPSSDPSTSPPGDETPEYHLSVRASPRHDHGRLLSWFIEGTQYGPLGGGPFSIQQDPNLSFPGLHAFISKPQRTGWCGWIDVQASYECANAQRFSDNVLWISYHTCCEGAGKDFRLDIAAAEGQFQASQTSPVALLSQSLSLTAKPWTQDADGNRVPVSCSAFHWTPRSASPAAEEEIPPAEPVTLLEGQGQQTATFRFNQVGYQTIVCWASGSDGAISQLAAIVVLVDRVDLDADTNRDGIITETDESVEDAAPGLIAHVNHDNDDEATEPDAQKQVDAENSRIDGTEDRSDLYPLDLRFSPGWTQLPAGTVRLQQTGGDGTVRIFLDDGQNGRVVLGPDSPLESTDLWADLSAGRPRFLLEGVSPGLATLKLEYSSGGVSSGDFLTVSVIRVEIVRGQVDPVSGRGVLGSASKVLQSVSAGEALPASSPVPFVDLQDISVENLAADGNQRFTGDLTVTGAVTFALADIVPGGAADPTTATLFVAGQEAGIIALAREAESPSLLRPYAARFPFSKTFPSVTLTPSRCTVEVSVEDSVTGSEGADSAVVDLGPAQATAGDANPTSLFLARGLSQPVRIRLDFHGPWPSLEALQMAGPNAISIIARKTYEPECEPFMTSAGLSLTPGANPRIRSADGKIDVEVLEAGGFGLDTATRGRFSAVVQLPDLHWEKFPVTFEETAPDSQVYGSRFVEVAVTLTAPLSTGVPDTLSVQLTKSLYDLLAGMEARELQETAPDSRTFGGPDFQVSIVAMTRLSPSSRDEMTVAITHAQFGLSGHPADAAETGPDTRAFETDQVFTDDLPESEDYAHAWLQGPWKVASVTHRPSRKPGPYIPLLVRVQGPQAVASSGLKCDFFGAEHTLVVQDGEVFCAGSPFAGNFTSVGNLRVGESFGGGHVSKKEGFVWATLGNTMKSLSVDVHNTVYALYGKLIEVAEARRNARFGPDFDTAYWPPAYAASDYPLNEMANLVWAFIETARMNSGLSSVNDDVRSMALERMNMNLPNFKVLGIPNCPNLFVATAVNLPEPAKVTTIGSRYLLGHWFNLSDDVKTDFASQRQNWTQIIHFNTGLGWQSKLRDRMAVLQAILENVQLSKKEKALAIMDWLAKNGYLVMLPEKMLDKLKKVGPYKAFVYGVSKSYQWKEIVDVMMLVRGFGGSSASALDFFLAYDIASGEAFHVFSIDPINDVIATEAGDRFYQDMASAASGIVSRDSVLAHLDTHLHDARQALASHKLFSSETRTLHGFLAVQLNMENGAFAPVQVEFDVPVTIWKRTLGMIIDKNKDKLADPLKREAFINRVASVVESYTVTNSSGDADLDEADVEALQQIVEVLNFITQ